MNYVGGLIMSYQNNDTLQNLLAQLKKDNTDKVILTGVIAHLLLSKETFKHNIDIEEFLHTCMDITLPDYVIKSRTLIISRVIRILVPMDNNQVRILNSHIQNYFSSPTIEKKKTTRKKNENVKLESWLKGL